MEKALIVGLGNPGKSYERTRHNIGFAAVDRLAKEHGFEFRNQLPLKGSIAEECIGNRSVILLKPLTFVNSSGEAVVLVMRAFQIDLPQLLILTDDVDLPLGRLRIRINSGTGGHNGLRSVEECLQTNQYGRLRIGVGGRKKEGLIDHVLGRFSEEEEQLIPGVLERVVQAVEIWLDKGITSAMDFANQKPSTPSIGDANE